MKNCSLTRISTAVPPTVRFDDDYNDGLNEQYYFLILLIVVNVTIAIVASFFNFLIIFVFLKNSYLRTPSNLLLFGLAITDFFAAFLTQPAFCVMLGAELTRNVLLSTISHSVWLSFVIALCSISFFNLTLITADRFLAVYLHLRYHQLVTTQRYCGVLVGIWLFGVLLTVVNFVLENVQSFLYVQISFIVLGFILNFTFILKIAKIIRRHSAQIHAQQQSTQPTMNMPRYKKSVNTMYFVIGCFLLCYGPQFLHIMFHNIAAFRFFTYTILMLNGVFNPVIYLLEDTGDEKCRRSCFTLYKTTTNIISNCVITLWHFKGEEPAKI